jgi:hypothetical protein
MKKISGMNFAHITEDVAGLGSGGDITLFQRKEHRKMNKDAKQPSNVKKEHDVDKHVQGGGQAGTVRPAEEIADDEVEIGRTGGKPGTKRTPITERKP